MKVLYAEDEFTNRKLFQIRMAKAGVECEVVADGQEALRLALENMYDVVVLDLYMPQLKGDEVAKHIKAAKPDVTIVAITSDSDSVAYLLEVGFDKVFIKPLLGSECVDWIVSQGGKP